MGLRDSLLGFLTGAFLSGVGGYYLLHQDIWRTSALLEESLSSQKADMEQRLSRVEAVVERLSNSSVEEDTMQAEDADIGPSAV